MLWPPAAAIVLAALYLLADLRRLSLAQVTNSWRGTSQTLRDLSLAPVAQAGDTFVHWATRDWWATVPIVLLVLIAGSLAGSYLIARPALRRIHAAVGFAPPRAPSVAPDDEAPDPVPVELRHVEYRYGLDPPALRDVSLAVEPGEFVAFVGLNGSGKSTLARILAGTPPTAGLVTRPGAAGLGRRHGSAVVFQRPEAQVLGVRVGDDVVWGLSDLTGVDVDAILERVGLAGFAARETSTLSGGELQRLALGAALARHPRLLVSDESTSMVDPDGRRAVVEVLRHAADADDVAVVHVTHRAEESAVADRVVALDHGRVVAAASVGTTVSRDAAPLASRPPHDAGGGLLALRGVGYEYATRTPWAHRALRDIDLEIDAGEGLLVLGHNGSGKSTLAWILAGVLTPTEGTATLAGQALTARVGHVGLAFQHARLQLLRSTVASDVAAASGADPDTVASTLDAVGLDPARFGPRRIDELSGGEMRRAALAGILAGRPRALVLDEPFAGLDSAGRTALADLLVNLRASTGISVVVVSHDDELPERLVDRVVELDHGQLIHDAPFRGASVRSAGRVSRRATPATDTTGRRRRPELILLRLLPRHSPLHDLWAGTKLLVVAALAVMVSVRPSWPTLAVAAAVVGTGILVARVPAGAVPRLPRWIWVLFVLWGLLNLRSGTPPVVHPAGVAVSLGGLEQWLLLSALAAVLIAAAFLVGWTTPLGEVSPALARLGAPFRWVRLPVDEWILAVGLAIRCLPLLVDETRTLVAVRRLRRRPGTPRPRPSRHLVRSVAWEAHDLLATAVVVSLRRARDLADAIEARGGVTAPGSAVTGPRRRDAVLLVAIAVVVVLTLTL